MHAVGQLFDPRVAGRLLGSIAQVEDRLAARHLPRMGVVGLQGPIPEEVGDAEVALLIVEMVCQVQLLDPLRPFPARLEGRCWMQWQNS